MTAGSTPSALGPQRGRPLGFERDALVVALMRAFWEFGWAGASYPRLEQRTGVARSSMSNTIGSKTELLVAALTRYLQVLEERLFGPLREGHAGLEDVLTFFARLRAGKQTEPGRWGCLMAIAMTEIGDDPAVARLTGLYRAELTAAFAAALRRAQAAAQLPPEDDPADLAAVLTAVAVGLNVAARAGAEGAELDAIVGGVERLLGADRDPQGRPLAVPVEPADGVPDVRR